MMDKSSFLRFFERSRSARPESTRVRAESGDAEAQFSLGFSFANQGSVAPDYAQAAHWYLKAADQNHALAQFNLGIMFSVGQGVTRDENQSDVWMRRAAQGGDAGAQHNLGSRCRRACFDEGAGNLRETRLEAYKWFSLAALQGYRGSDAAVARLTLDMSREEVTEGIHRATEFAAAHPGPVESKP
jgi:TPR repeat protein